ncbi:MAG TPA: carboxylesterase family protein [Myxococcales bacterium]|jgi:para-nitrobenzyl esterase|nr:carboxylesterase family protein [Myxococcales bacterium]
MRPPRPWISLVVLLAAGCHRPRAAEVHPQDPSSERAVAQGKVVGLLDRDGVHAWLGIPYAEPPVGPLRWRAPSPQRPWAGTFSAVQFGHACVQIHTPISGRDDDLRGKMMGSEDCLTLNVYAPRFTPQGVPAGKERLPVMVWIHGGGNKLGSSSYFEMARDLVARQGVMVVTVNYRLGVMGWFRHPSLFLGPDASPLDRSGNFGTLDLVLALQWVRDNAAAFGGDPGNVTIFGESAGATNVFSLLAAPPAKGLFHRAIAQSGMPASVTPEAAERFTEDGGDRGSSGELLLSLLQKDGRARDRAGAKAALAAMDGAAVAAYLRGKTADELISVLDAGLFAMYESPALFRDGTVLPREAFLDLVTDAGRYNAVPTLVGTNRDELKLFMALDPAYVDRWLGVLPQIKDVAEYNRTADYASSFWKVAGADWPAALLRRAQGPSVYAYRFDWDEEPKRFGVDLSVLLGAAHGMEIAFVFSHVDEDGFGVQDASNREGMRALSRAMSGYWAQFARAGAPGKGPGGALPEWKPWSDESPESERYMVFDSPAGGGVRMASQPVTVESLTRRLEREPAFDAAPKERCRAYARVVQALKGLTARAGDEDYARFAGGACRPYPAATLLVGSSRR